MTSHTQQIATGTPTDATKWGTPTETDGTNHRPTPTTPTNRCAEEQ